jgi:hypothetical protein
MSIYTNAAAARAKSQLLATPRQHPPCQKRILAAPLPVPNDEIEQRHYHNLSRCTSDPFRGRDSLRLSLFVDVPDLACANDHLFGRLCACHLDCSERHSIYSGHVCWWRLRYGPLSRCVWYSGSLGWYRCYRHYE